VKPRFFHLTRRAVLRAILAHYDGPEFERRIREAEEADASPGD
jgi:hypothetical protein